MPRILYASFDRVPAPKGASRHIEALVGGLTRASFAVDLCALKGVGEVAGASLVPCAHHAGNFLSRAGAFGEHVLQTAMATRYDLWHVRGIWEGLPLALWRTPAGMRPPLIYEVNGLPSIEMPNHFATVANQPALLARLRRQELALLAAADLIVTPSEVTAACLVELGATASKIRVVPNGVDLGAYGRPSADDAGPEVVYLGTFAPWQGLTTLIRALAQLGPPVRLRLIGPPGRGWARELAALAAALGVHDRVVIQPPVSPALVPALLSRARVCVAPLDGSARNLIQGCCPLKILEYMAAGRPIVASRLPAVEAMITHGEDAWLVPPDDPTALAAGLATVLGDPALASRLGVQARRRVERATWAIANQQILACYEELGVRPAVAAHSSS